MGCGFHSKLSLMCIRRVGVLSEAMTRDALQSEHAQRECRSGHSQGGPTERAPRRTAGAAPLLRDDPDPTSSQGPWLKRRRRYRPLGGPKRQPDVHLEPAVLV